MLVGAMSATAPSALASAADAISFDLEDAVVESRKAEAREAVAACLRSPAAAASGKTLIVRINAWGSPHAAADLQAVALPTLHLVNLPKPQSVDEVVAVAQALTAAEAAHAMPRAIGLLLNIESPRALRQAHELAGAHPRVAGLQLGLGDLFEPLSIARRDPQAVQQALWAMRLAAGEAGVWACDSAFADVADGAGFRAEAQQVAARHRLAEQRAARANVEGRVGDGVGDEKAIWPRLGHAEGPRLVGFDSGQLPWRTVERIEANRVDVPGPAPLPLRHEQAPDPSLVVHDLHPRHLRAEASPRPAPTGHSGGAPGAIRESRGAGSAGCGRPGGRRSGPDRGRCRGASGDGRRRAGSGEGARPHFAGNGGRVVPVGVGCVHAAT